MARAVFVVARSGFAIATSTLAIARTGLAIAISEIVLPLPGRDPQAACEKPTCPDRARLVGGRSRHIDFKAISAAWNGVKGAQVRTNTRDRTFVP